jgi:hypothetical protein
MRQIVERTLMDFLRLDMLINNAAFSPAYPASPSKLCLRTTGNGAERKRDRYLRMHRSL